MKMVAGGILLAVGILIAGASGVCSLYILFSNLGSPYGSASQFLGSLGIVFLFGGLPFAAGIGLILSGRSLIRDARNDGSRR